MAKINKACYVALIFTVISVFLCSDVAYSIDSDFFDKLRIRLDDPRDPSVDVSRCLPSYLGILIKR